MLFNLEFCIKNIGLVIVNLLRIVTTIAETVAMKNYLRSMFDSVERIFRLIDVILHSKFIKILTCLSKQLL